MGHGRGGGGGAVHGQAEGRRSDTSFNKFFLPLDMSLGRLKVAQHQKTPTGISRYGYVCKILSRNRAYSPALN